MKSVVRSGKLFALILFVFTAPSALAGISLPSVDGPAVLTVSGVGYWNQQQLYYGDSPYISEIDSDGEMLRDGVYQYELKSVPSANAAATGYDGISLVAPPIAATSSTLETGSFTIEGGALVQQN